MHASYYYRAHACIMVFDVTRKVCVQGSHAALLTGGAGFMPAGPQGFTPLSAYGKGRGIQQHRVACILHGTACMPPSSMTWQPGPSVNANTCFGDHVCLQVTYKNLDTWYEELQVSRSSEGMSQPGPARTGGARGGEGAGGRKELGRRAVGWVIQSHLDVPGASGELWRAD